MKNKLNKHKLPYYNRTEFPIEIVKLEDNSYHILVAVSIKDAEGELIIDTGASISVIDSDRFALPTLNNEYSQVQSKTINGNIDHIDLITCSDLKIGKWKVRPVKMAAISLNHINAMYEKQLSRTVFGLLGSDFLVRHKAIIDYNRQILSCIVPNY